MVSVTITFSAKMALERKWDSAIAKVLDLLGQLTFLLAAVLAVTSGITYFIKNKHMFAEEDKSSYGKN